MLLDDPSPCCFSTFDVLLTRMRREFFFYLSKNRKEGNEFQLTRNTNKQKKCVTKNKEMQSEASTIYHRRQPQAALPSAHHDNFACVVVSVAADGAATTSSSTATTSGSYSSPSLSDPPSPVKASSSGSTPASSSYQVQQLVAKDGTILTVVYRRLSVLVSLLLLQSMSQFVLEAFEDVVQANIVIPLFLTMLVGAGGNAGNQSAVRAIAMLAKGEINGSRLAHVLPVIKRECVIGFICAAVLSTIGALRVFMHQVMRKSGGAADTDAAALATVVNSAAAPAGYQPPQQAGIAVTVFAISASLFMIVFLSAAIGVVLPFLFLKFGSNAENAAPAIQVIMDVLGVFLTCVVCWVLLPTSPNAAPPPVLGKGDT